jgi:hypothetical protein
MWKNSAMWGRLQMTIWGMRISSWILKATKIHSEYVVIMALPLQQWLHESTFMLPYKYIACLVYDSHIRHVNIPYILEFNPHPNLIRTSFRRFLKRKKKVSSRFQSAPFVQPLLAYKADW